MLIFVYAIIAILLFCIINKFSQINNQLYNSYGYDMNSCGCKNNRYRWFTSKRKNTNYFNSKNKNNTNSIYKQSHLDNKKKSKSENMKKVYSGSQGFSGHESGGRYGGFDSGGRYGGFDSGGRYAGFAVQETVQNHLEGDPGMVNKKSNYQESLPYMALENDVFKSQKTWLYELPHSTTVSSKDTVRDDRNDINPQVGLRRSNYQSSAQSHESNRTVHSEYPYQMPQSGRDVFDMI